MELDAIGAAPASHTTVAATTTVLGHVKLGTVAGTACPGNDSRLTNARTPTAHKATHKTGGTDALLPEEIGAARGSRISATTSATAGWYRIAQSATSISNCMGLFEITGAVSGAHSVSLISAGISYGKAPGLIQLAHAPFSTPAITKARIVYHPTYSGNFAYLEVYLAQAKAIPISVNLIGGQGWTLVAPSTAGAVPSGYSTKELTLAEGKIVANVNGSISGNAGTATRLATARTIALSGDATASGTFDGSGNLTLAATLKNSGATAGSYGPTAAATLAFGGSVNVPQVTVDAKGRITAVANRAIKLPAAPTAITGNAGTATKWATKRTIDGVQVDGSANVHHYVTCSTAAATVEKAVALAGFVLATGARITVRFTVTNTAANPTLNVSGTGAKAIRYRNAAISAGYLAVNRTYDFVYDGTYYQLVGDLDTNTTYAAATVAPKAAGTAAVGTSAKYAREDHVHPVQTTVSGNAGTATKLATARTIALSGDVTASGTFDGSGNLTLTAALKNSGATAGAYGPGANATPAFNATFSVPQITVDAKGRVTAAATRTVKIPANPVATQNANGLLSAADKKKLDGFAASGIMNIDYKSYKDFTLGANFTMPYDGIATVFPTGCRWGVTRLYVDGIEVGRARLYGEDNASATDSVSAIVKSGSVVKGEIKDASYPSGYVRCFKCA